MRLKKKRSEIYLCYKKIKRLKLEDSLNDIIKNSLQKLAIKKVMSYQLEDGWTSVNFARPMRGLIVLHGKQVLNANVLGCTSSNKTRGHRFESIKKLSQSTMLMIMKKL